MRQTAAIHREQPEPRRPLPQSAHFFLAVPSSTRQNGEPLLSMPATNSIQQADRIEGKNFLSDLQARGSRRSIRARRQHINRVASDAAAGYFRQMVPHESNINHLIITAHPYLPEAQFPFQAALCGDLTIRTASVVFCRGNIRRPSLEPMEVGRQRTATHPQAQPVSIRQLTRRRSA